MDKILHVASTFKSLENDDGSVMIRGMASTNHSDRAGDVISKEAWEKGGLENFKNNPVILFNHDYDKPIGRATGVKVTENGLELEAKISKSAPAAVCELVKDGVLGAFSVGFKVKDADYIKETDGLMIKDAELFEVSVVSVPCNQAATFSLAKSFDSQEEYNEFKKTFTNRVDLTGQSLTKEDEISSNLVSDAPTSSEKSEKQEIKMDTNESKIDLEAFAKKVAEETAAKIAMKQAETKAADEAQAKIAADAAEAKAAQDEQVKTVIRTGIETGAERLKADMEADFAKAKDSEMADVVKKYEADVAEKSAELEAMRNSKMEFSGKSGDQSEFAKSFLHASVLGAITGKGMETDYARGLVEKAGTLFGANTPVDTNANIDLTVSQSFEEEVSLATKVAGLFREIPVTSQATIIPFVEDVDPATVSATGIGTAGNQLQNGGTQDQFDITKKIINTERIIAGTFIDNDTDEKSLISFLPMITSALAKAHGKAIDKALLYGTAGANLGLAGGTNTDKSEGFLGTQYTVTAQSVGTKFDGDHLTQGRNTMGKFGVNPSDIAYVVSLGAYFDLLEDANFQTVDQIGNDRAVILTGQVGSLYGSPVIVSDVLAPASAGSTAVCIYTPGFVIGRLRGVSIESDYEVANQRNAIVASQAIGFSRIQNAQAAAVAVLTAD